MDTNKMSQNNEVMNNGEDLVNQMEINAVRRNKNNNVVLIVFIVVMVLALGIGSFFWFNAMNEKKESLSSSKTSVKTIYIFQSIDKENPERISSSATDKKEETVTDEYSEKKILATYECTTDCYYRWGNDEDLAIYDNKLLEYNFENNKFNEVKKSNEYKMQDYKFTTFDKWIVGEYKGKTDFGCEWLSLHISIDEGKAYDVKVSLNSLESGSYAIFKDNNLSIYNGNELFYEEERTETYLDFYDKVDGFYLVGFYSETFMITESKERINVELCGDSFSVYDNKLIISTDTSIDIYDKDGNIISSSPYTKTASVYDNYAFVNNNGELQIINVLDNQIIYNFGAILESEEFVNNLDGSYYAKYINRDGVHTFSMFLEDVTRSNNNELLPNGDNMIGRRFTYDFNTGEVKIEDASAFASQVY